VQVPASAPSNEAVTTAESVISPATLLLDLALLIFPKGRAHDRLAIQASTERNPLRFR
jgi:hypothetical protein